MILKKMREKMSHLRLRYALTPQMLDYDNLSQSWLPYLMYFHSPDYASTSVNTDTYGFRITCKGGEKINTFEKNDTRSVNLLCGGSCAFGVGATADAMTIASFLCALTNQAWLNFGGRAFNSTQEFLLFLFYRARIANIKNIVLLSGINNLILYYLSGLPEDHLGSFFFSRIYSQSMQKATLSFRERLTDLVFKKRNIRESLIVSADAKGCVLEILERDIANWKIFSDAQGINLIYALQPFANWTDKRLSREEKALFDELDINPQNHFRVIKNKLDLDLRSWFLASLKEICGTHNVRFLDMNAYLSKYARDEEWIFVDRAHLNDVGNRYIAQALTDSLS